MQCMKGMFTLYPVGHTTKQVFPSFTHKTFAISDIRNRSYNEPHSIAFSARNVVSCDVENNACIVLVSSEVIVFGVVDSDKMFSDSSSIWKVGEGFAVSKILWSFWKFSGDLGSSVLSSKFDPMKSLSTMPRACWWVGTVKKPSVEYAIVWVHSLQAYFLYMSHIICMIFLIKKF